jgi:hypothetical protein
MQLEVDLDRPHHERLRQLQDRLQQPLDIIIARLVDLGYAISAKDSALATMLASESLLSRDWDVPGEAQAGEPPEGRPAGDNRMASLNWTQAEMLETRLKLRRFADDWDAPGMDAYNER